MEELERISADRRIEVVRGQLREIDMSAAYVIHGVINANVLDILRPFAKQHKLGLVIGDNVTFVLSLMANTVRESRIPDIAFIRRERLQKFDLHQTFPGAPDLAVEVVSESESQTDLDEKISDYFAAGTEQVWAVYPRAQVIHVYRREENLTPKTRTYHLYRAGDILEAPTLFPGLQIEVAAVFAQEI
ncbi:MAG: Uma2 family endonuclease [bacterium]|nr:Uma2 family endonuclease [bacterium]